MLVRARSPWNSRMHMAVPAAQKLLLVVWFSSSYYNGLQDSTCCKWLIHAA